MRRIRDPLQWLCIVLAGTDVSVRYNCTADGQGRNLRFSAPMAAFRLVHPVNGRFGEQHRTAAEGRDLSVSSAN
jgi:hypothetical protein